MPTAIPANRAPLEALSVARVTGGRAMRASGRTAIGATTDSRTVTPGCAFVALRGAWHDGHAYVSAAIAAGAALVVVERGRDPGTHSADIVEVDDTLVAWGAIAQAHVRAWRHENPDARVIAISGSAGKTTTKEICASFLSTVGECHATPGNLNNRVGVPSVALQLEARHRFVVLEMGMSVAGEIAALAAITEPDVAVLTNVGLAHAAGVGGSIADVAREKGALFAAVRPGGVVVANADDPAVLRQVARAPSARAVTFGVAERADYRLLSRQPLGAAGSRAVVGRAGVASDGDARSITLDVPIPGQAAAIDFVAALAAADAAAGVPLAVHSVAAALRSLPPIRGRMRPRRLGGGILVLDDAYNANPASMRAALATLTEVGEGRRVAVLGEMKELGERAEQELVSLAAAVAAAGVELLISCGGLADVVARGAAERRVAVVLARDASEAARLAVERVQPGDIVLVKASRGVRADLVVEALLLAHREEGT